MTAKKKDSLKYGEARERLEAILKEIEGESVDVDDLAERVKEAAGLIQLCRQKLEKTRVEVEKVVVEMNLEGEVRACEEAGEAKTGEEEDDNEEKIDPESPF